MIKQIGDYAVCELLGKSAIAEVYRVVHKKSGMSYAAKIFNKSLIMKKNLEKPLSNQIKIMSKISHPNIIQLIEVLKTNDDIVIIMEYADGGDLYNMILERGSLSETIARKYFHQIIDALVFLHEHEILHCNLTLSNVLITRAEKIKLTGFSLFIESPVIDNTLAIKWATSPYFIAPEVFSGKPYGTHSDIWSTGVILYSLLHARLPFNGQNDNELKISVLQCHANFSQSLSDSVIILLKSIFTRYPNKRIQIEQILENEWFNYKYSPNTGKIDHHIKVKIENVMKIMVNE